MLTEFGGIALPPPRTMRAGDTREVETAEDLAEAYSQLLTRSASFRCSAGFCYTQFADTYQERNGLLYADRTPKFPIERIAEATTGPEFQRFEATTAPAQVIPKIGRGNDVTAKVA